MKENAVNETLREYRVWDLPTRWFHWINFFCVLALSFVGLLLMFRGNLGITGTEAKVGLKVLHVSIGYLFAANLLVRVIWGFVGNRFARWSTTLPGPGFGAQLRDYKASLKAGEPQAWLGHNPLGRLAVSAMLLLLLTIAVTGMVRGGTDVYMPPLGGAIKSWLAESPAAVAEIRPYEKQGIDPARQEALDAFKHPFGVIHVWAVYLLWLVAVVHIAAVVLAEVRESGGLVSAMINGRKVLAGKPVDE